MGNLPPTVGPESIRIKCPVGGLLYSEEVSTITGKETKTRVVIHRFGIFKRKHYTG
jgi:hypothetical protein